MRLARLAGLMAAGALALSVAAPVGAADGNAMIRVLHGSPDAPAVDVFANDAKVDALSNLSFGSITDYAAVPAGTYSIKVCATADNTVCPIGPVDLTFAAGKKYTIAASDLLASIKANVFTDNAAPTEAKSQVRVVHLSADTPAVDVLTQDKSAAVVSNLAYPKATGYLTLDPGSYDLIVCANADHSVCPLDPGALNLEAGTAYSVFAVGALQPADGQQARTAVVAVDGNAPPATDTVGAADASSGVSPLALIALAAAGIAGLLAAARRFAPAAIRTR
ncbi:MAG: DUF4397 domain-containing protein [Chloroflexota bacterium]